LFFLFFSGLNHVQTRKCAGLGCDALPRHCSLKKLLIVLPFHLAIFPGIALQRKRQGFTARARRKFSVGQNRHVRLNAGCFGRLRYSAMATWTAPATRIFVNGSFARQLD